MSKRLVVGMLSAGCLAAALYLYLIVGYDESNAFWLGVFVRLGIVLLTICLAWPNLANMSSKAPRLMVVTLLIALAFLVIRPRLLRIVAPLVLLTWVAHYGLRLLARSSK